MELKETIYLSSLFDIYKQLLTEKQQTILTYYLINDLGFAEIAELENITRQAVLDCITKSVKQLNRYEDVCKVYATKQTTKSFLQNLSLSKQLTKDINNFLDNL